MIPRRAARIALLAASLALACGCVWSSAVDGALVAGQPVAEVAADFDTADAARLVAATAAAMTSVTSPINSTATSSNSTASNSTDESSTTSPAAITITAAPTTTATPTQSTANTVHTNSAVSHSSMATVGATVAGAMMAIGIVLVFVQLKRRPIVETDASALANLPREDYDGTVLITPGATGIGATSMGPLSVVKEEEIDSPVLTPSRVAL